MNLNDLCFVSTDAWEELKLYRFVGHDENEAIQLKEIRSTGKRRLSPNEELELHPFSIRAHLECPPDLALYRLVLDIMSSLVGQTGKAPLNQVIDRVRSDKRLQGETEKIVFILQALIAEGYMKAIVKGNRHTRLVYLEHGVHQKEIEKRRGFAASMASELDALSHRVRLIISHGSTVGGYREQLLITMLRKHLPERYHVASGFIYGCNRQFDVLIYDRIEYAPLFREGDLVVAPPNAVRAVIEVKTTLDMRQLKKSLDILHHASDFDDGYPPIFKGIFAFDSRLSEKNICKHIYDFYMNGYYYQSQPHGSVRNPFGHFTCACIYGKHYVHTRYCKTIHNEYIPTLYSKQSNTGLQSQVAWFMQELLAHLRYSAAKNNYFSYEDEMLGTDTIETKYQQIAELEWGPYFDVANGNVAYDEADAYIQEAEQRINGVQNWLAGTTDSWRV